MPLFGPPDIDMLSEKGNVKGLLKALGDKKDEQIRVRAAQALAWMGDERALKTLEKISADQSEPEALRKAAGVAREAIRFVQGALRNTPRLRCRIKIEDIHHVYYALALGYRKNQNLDSRRAIALVETHFSAACAVCGQIISGDTLSTVGTLQESGSNFIMVGGSGQTSALVAGKCANPGCKSREIHVYWR